MEDIREFLEKFARLPVFTIFILVFANFLLGVGLGLVWAGYYYSQTLFFRGVVISILAVLLHMPGLWELWKGND